MVNDEQAERAADYIRDNAKAFATAKAHRVYCEEYRKSLKAILFNNYEGAAAVREQLAYADDRYTAHLEEIRQAVLEEETIRGLIKAAEQKIEVWRSQSANLRGRI
jgi:hypothetical protein